MEGPELFCLGGLDNREELFQSLKYQRSSAMRCPGTVSFHVLVARRARGTSLE